MTEDISLILKYFPGITETQKQQFAQLKPLYTEWNSQINVISRKDIEQLYERHVLHSLGIAKIIEFKDNTKIMDVGTGGGFPGIPLAILFPECRFYLIDSIGKKIKVVNAVAEALGLENVYAEQIRAEEMKDKFDFIVSRAVTRLPEFQQWVKGKILKTNFNDLPNGILYLKGGDLTEELASIKQNTKTFELSDFFQEEFFETKKVVYVALK
jgi:16S rRNA (guanine527-N7)-methyltransferase